MRQARTIPRGVRRRLFVLLPRRYNVLCQYVRMAPATRPAMIGSSMFNFWSQRLVRRRQCWYFNHAAGRFPPFPNRIEIQAFMSSVER